MKPRTFTPTHCAGCGHKFRNEEPIHIMTFEPTGLHIGYAYPLCRSCVDSPSPEMVRRINAWLEGMHPELKALPPGPTGRQTFDFRLPAERCDA
jgi:hypothetical protein